jgi:SAM-dependent methyltransferase
VTASIELSLDSSQAFDVLVEELGAALARQGVQFERGLGGRVVEGRFEVGRVIAWEPGTRVLLEWRQADWAPDDITEVELRCETTPGGTRVSVEHRGFGNQFWGEAEPVGWFADQVAAPLLVVVAPERLGEWLTDRGARRPSGASARDSYRNPTHHRPSFGAVLAALGLQRHDVLLEIGCGGGAFLQQALQSGCRAAGVDHSSEMVRVARELNAEAIAAGRLELMGGSAESLPFPDSSFTCAAMMQVFFFLPDPAAALCECRRVLGPAGRLAVFTVSEKAKGTPAAPEPMASRARFYADEELVRLAHEAGFDGARVDHPDLEPHARAAGLPDDVVAMFVGDQVGSQLLVANVGRG